MIFLNRMLRKIFGRNENEVTQKWEIQYNEEIYELYFSPNSIRVTKSRRMRWVWYVVRMGDGRVIYKDYVARREGRNHLEDPSVDGRILLKRIIEK